mmetsp:Transcript_56111/g.180078  ORF Transcript_56111/g.180078 Transcript_56111/m.180078 type:complete len:398 (+) Transcript_56111:74-1267(+)
MPPFPRRRLGLLLAAAWAARGCRGEADSQCEPTPGKSCKLRVGVVGGAGSWWHAIQSASIVRGGTRRVVAGVLSSKPERALEAAAAAGIAGYGTWQAMLDAWRKGELDLDYVVIQTPNSRHAEPAKAFIEAGLPVYCEKPMTVTLAEAEALQSAVEAKGVPFALSHTYTGHPMVMFAKEYIRGGHLGEVQKVECWFNQDWAASHRGYSWRFDPALAGISGVGADLGTHSFIAATWVTGRSVKRVAARLKTFTEGRQLDESFNVLAELDNGGTAVIMASAISVGFKNEHGFRIFGSKGSMEWGFGTSGALLVRTLDKGPVLFRFEDKTHLPASIASYGEENVALPNLHLSLERTIRLKRGEDVPAPFDHPGVREGVASMRFIHAAVESSKKGGAWTSV